MVINASVDVSHSSFSDLVLGDIFDKNNIKPLFLEELRNKDLQNCSFKKLLKLAQTSPDLAPLLRNLYLNLWDDPCFMSTRVLVEMGKSDPRKVNAIFDLCLQQKNSELRWLCAQEIVELVKIHPQCFISVLKKIVRGGDQNIQWMVLISLILASEKSPDYINTLFSMFPEDYFPDISLSLKRKCHVLSVEECISKFIVALINDQEDLQWAILLELIDYAAWYPKKVIPMLGKASQSHFPSIQWMSLLQLVKMASQHPSSVAVVLRGILSESDYVLSIPPLQERVLILLGKEYLHHYLDIFMQALQHQNVYLKFNVLYELVEICDGDFFQLSAILKNIP